MRSGTTTKKKRYCHPKHFNLSEVYTVAKLHKFLYCTFYHWDVCSDKLCGVVISIHPYVHFVFAFICPLIAKHKTIVNGKLCGACFLVLNYTNEHTHNTA